MKEALLISACLLGIDCRYDGKNNHLDNATIKKLNKKYHLVAVCPEQMGGLATPRVPSEIQADGRVLDKNGKDVSSCFIKGAEIACSLAHMHNAKKALLKANSPSCGNKQVYDGLFRGRAVPGKGIAAEMLEKQGITVFNENEIKTSLGE